MVIENSYGLLTMMMAYLIIFFVAWFLEATEQVFYWKRLHIWKSDGANTFTCRVPLRATDSHTILSIAGLRHRKCIPFNTFYTVSLLFASSLLFYLFLFEVQFSSTESHTVAIEFTFNIQFWWQIQSTFVVSFFYEIIVWKDTIIVGKKKKSTREKMKTKE
jgi:hypothetical protein